MGFAMKQPTVQPRTRLAHAVAKWTAEHGRFDAFNQAVFKAFFQDSLDIGKQEILLQIAGKIGMDTKSLDSGTQLNSYMDQVVSDEDMARVAGVKAVPAYVADNRVLAAGVQSLSQLQHLIATV